MKSTFRNALFRLLGVVPDGDAGQSPASTGASRKDSVDQRLSRVEWKLNVALLLLTVVVLQPFIGTLVAWMKYGVLLVMLMAVCLGLALFRHRIPDAARAVWTRITAGPPSSRSADSQPQTTSESTSPAA